MKSPEELYPFYRELYEKLWAEVLDGPIYSNLRVKGECSEVLDQLLDAAIKVGQILAAIEEPGILTEVGMKVFKDRYGLEFPPLDLDP